MVKKTKGKALVPDNTKREIMIARVIFASTVLVSGGLFVNSIIRNGIGFWLIVLMIIWLVLLWRFWFNIKKGSLTLTFMLGYFFLAIIISIIALAVATPQNSTAGDMPQNQNTSGSL